MINNTIAGIEDTDSGKFNIVGTVLSIHYQLLTTLEVGRTRRRASVCKDHLRIKFIRVVDTGSQWPIAYMLVSVHNKNNAVTPVTPKGDSSNKILLELLDRKDNLDTITA